MAEGNSYVNLCLAILKQAKDDADKDDVDNEMWTDFQETLIYQAGVRGNVNSLDVAEWVCNFIS